MTGETGRQMVIPGVHRKGVLPWLVRWARRDFCPAITTSRPSTKYVFHYRTLFHLICSHRPASWCHAGSPVS